MYHCNSQKPCSLESPMFSFRRRPSRYTLMGRYDARCTRDKVVVALWRFSLAATLRGIGSAHDSSLPHAALAALLFSFRLYT